MSRNKRGNRTQEVDGLSPFGSTTSIVGTLEQKLDRTAADIHEEMRRFAAFGRSKKALPTCKSASNPLESTHSGNRPS